MEVELVVPSQIRDQLRTFLSGLSNEQVANILYILAEWPEEFVQYCYEYEEAATDRFARMLREEDI